VLRWLATMSTVTAVLVLTGATLVGIILTLIAGQRPGVLLGIFIVAGSLAAVAGIRRPAVYVLFPLPAIAFFFGALITGIVHDSQLASTTAGLGTSFLQWVSGVFVPMVIATIVVVVIGGGRLLFGSQLVTGRPPQAAGPPAPGGRRPARSDSWATDDPFDGRNLGSTGPTARPGTGPGPRADASGPAPRQGGTGPVPGPGTAARPGPGAGRGGRPGREPRTDRDPWGDPRLPPDRSQPPADPRPRPAGSSQPGDGQPRDGQPRDGQPRDGQATPRDGQTPPRNRGPRPSWNPAARPQGRPQPPEGWNQR
jgi:hypothetical protein